MNGYKIDFASKTMTITKAFAEAASDPSSDIFRHSWFRSVKGSYGSCGQPSIQGCPSGTSS